MSYFQILPANYLARQRSERKLAHDPIEEEIDSVKGYSDFVNGALCFFVGVLWVAICQLMSDKSVSVAIILLPFLAFAVAGTYLIARFRVKNLR